ncbi:hypothetical protein V6N13_042865 [Hibiscus sabdariffa]
MRPGRTIANGYMQWFYENGKPFILGEEERTRVIPRPRPERPRQQCGSRSISASTRSRQRTQAPYTFGVSVPPSGGPFTKPYTPIPSIFSHLSGSQFHFTMAPPTKGFFTWTVLLFCTYVPDISGPLAVYQPLGPNFGFSYGMVEHTPPDSLFAIGLSGSGAHDDDEDEDEDDIEAHRSRIS